MVFTLINNATIVDTLYCRYNKQIILSGSMLTICHFYHCKKISVLRKKYLWQALSIHIHTSLLVNTGHFLQIFSYFHTVKKVNDVLLPNEEMWPGCTTSNIQSWSSLSVLFRSTINIILVHKIKLWSRTTTNYEAFGSVTTLNFHFWANWTVNFH